MRMLPVRRIAFLTSALLAAVALSGCSTISAWTPSAFKSSQTNVASSSAGVETSKERRFLGIFSPYRVDIQQGNFVSREMVAQVKENMKSPEGITREQVRFVMGTPLVTDVFHEDRWDYVFRLEKNNGDIIRSNVSMHFEGNKLVKLDGGDLPTEKDYLALIAGTKALPPPELGMPAPAKKPGSK